MTRFLKSFLLALLVMPFALTQAATINVPLDHATIQAAIDAAAPGDTVLVADGIYNESLTISKSLTLEGNSESGVTINAADSNTRGIQVISSTTNVALRKFTLDRPSSTNCTTTCFGIKIEGGSGHIIEDVTVTNSPRSGVDLNGVTSGAITNVTVTGSVFGNGIGLTDTSNVTMTNITTSGNSFGGIAVYTGAGFFPTGSTGIVLTGVNSIGETNPLYYQKASSADPLGIDASTDFAFVVMDATGGSDTQGYFQTTLPNAIAGAVILENILDTGDLTGATPSTRLASPVVILDLSDNSERPDGDIASAGYQTDSTAPVFDSMLVRGEDSTNTPKTPVAGTVYVVEGDKILFRTRLTTADTLAAGQGPTATVGGTAISIAPYLESATPLMARGRRYTVMAGDNGDLVLTGLTFDDQAGNAITGVVLPNPTNIVVDTMAPSVMAATHTSSGAWARYAAEGDTVTYDITFDEAVDISVNSASSATNIAGAPTTEISGTGVTTAQIIFTVAVGDDGEVVPTVDFDITDVAGNVTTITSLAPITGGGFDGKIFADTTPPTLDVVSIASDNANSSEWATTGDEVKVQIQASEVLRNNSIVATIAGKTATVTKTCGNPNCDTYDLTVVLDGSETEGPAAIEIDFKDRAGNDGMQVVATTDSSEVTVDFTAPTVPTVAIASNNVLDTTLAKTNDTVTVTFEIADNLSTIAALMGMPAASILSSAITGSNVSMVAPGQTIERFTDGSEDSEVVVPFSFAVRDIAGNVSALINATTDSSEVKFDRTDPVIRNVRLKAFSADNTASQDDVPTYYAKQGDRIRLVLQVCDYVDSDSNPPTGTFFGQPITMVDAGLVGSPGNCTTGDGNTSQWRRWRSNLTNVDGTEGFVTFDVTVNDNAGNQLANVTGVTDGSSVIFDKTMPTTPTDVMDLGGVATPNYKPFEQADYTWSDEEDPMGGTPVSGLYQNDLRYFNPNTGINEMVTIDYPTQAFTPASVIPDVDPYIVFMNVRDKAGNASGETNTYEQAYGVTLDGTILDHNGDPVPNGIVQVIAATGETCNGVVDVCPVLTDASGNYMLTVAPNQVYTVNFYGTHFLYLEKQLVNVTTANLTKSVQLELIEGNQVQTLNQPITIKTTTSTIIVAAESGTISTEKVDQNTLRITSVSDINSVISDNPNDVVTRISDNEFLVTTTGTVTEVTDTFTQTDVSRVGLRNISGGGHSGSYSGMSRAERLTHGDSATYAESLAWAQKMNEGQARKTHFYINRNGYLVFAGYQEGRMGLDDFEYRFENYVVFRGDKNEDRRGKEFASEDLEPQQARIKAQFQTVRDEEGYRERLGDVPNKNRYASLMTLDEEDRGPLAGYGKKVDVYHTVNTKREHEKTDVNKFTKQARDTSLVAKSRLNKRISPYVVRLQHGGKSVAMGAILDKERQGPRVVQRDRVEVFGQ